MKETPFNVDNLNFDEPSKDFNLKVSLLKYFTYWRWFLLTMFLCLLVGLFYAKITPKEYETTGKIRIIDDSKELNVAADALSLIGKGAINLENEIEVIKSYRLLSQVVSDLKLDVNLYKKGRFRTKNIWNFPISINKGSNLDTLQNTVAYNIVIYKDFFLITDQEDKDYKLNFKENTMAVEGLPFSINILEESSLQAYVGECYNLIISPFKDAVLGLSKSLEANVTSKNSDIISLSIKGENPKKSEKIINAVINNFDQDGILDRQLVSKRTLEVIDKRFVYLAGELDSIEIGKQAFKQANKLSYIEADAGEALQKKSDTESEVFQLEAQISLAQMLKNTIVRQAEYSLLPADIGLENDGLNTFVQDYNKLALKREKLNTSVSSNHPSLLELSGALERGKVNILKSINVYQAQLNNSLNRLNKKKNITGDLFSKLPEKEKELRSIERQQSIKENLFLLLLQKREEAAITLAATVPSIKVIDYALTGKIPISPKTKIIYLFCLFIGFLVPFLLLYLRFTLDTKVNDRSDIEKLVSDIPIVSEIPLLKEKKTFDGPNDDSILAELFRIGCTNVNYLLPKKSKGQAQVIFVTSGVKGEGKTLVALNLSLAYASIKKKVLLVGADLRSPALNNHFDSKGKHGLSDYLSDSTLDWKSCVYDSKRNMEFHKVCIGGSIPLNAAELLSGNRFGEFIEEAKAEFDYIVVDTSPTLLVTDTLLISEYADVSLFVIRAGYTDKGAIDFAENLKNTKKLHNMAFVLNDVDLGNSKNYNYGYGYGNDEEFYKNEYSKKNTNLLEKILTIFSFVKQKIKKNIIKKN
ncbi:tyrosine-protein kinase domain-containing protein [uncultured Maribacter sp.]|uniref:GumC family protein n=1 Tax=uncultured Maribacter sp. TaxID=431308 RepID=UPI0026069A60|nr:tyrosine-protein kinase domain-containing protein [uncultured Maribacter sp.]